MNEKQIIIVDRCISNLFKVTGAVFASTKLIRRFSFDDALKYIASITNYASTLVKSGYLPNDFATKMSLSKGYDDLYLLLGGIMKHYSVLTEEREKSRYRSDLVEFFRAINLSLRKLSETVKDCDSTLIDSVGRLLFNVNELIVALIEDDEFRDKRGELKERLAWNIHLPSFFASYAEEFDGGSNPFNTLTDSVAKTGILAAERLKDKKLVRDCVDCLYSITKHTLKKTTSKYGYDEPRVLEKACYLGILALKKGWDDVFTEVGLKIYEFEPNYFAKYLTNLPAGIDPEDHNVTGLPHKDQLFIELLRWRDDFERERWNGNLRIRDDAEAVMYSLIEPIDIDRFMFEVWGKFPANSEVEEELKLKFARRKLTHTLVQIGRKK